MEIPQPQEPDEFGNFQWQLDASIYKQRKKWADSKGFHETDRSRNAAFQADWSRCCQDRLVHLTYNPNPSPSPSPNPNPNPHPHPNPNPNQVLCSALADAFNNFSAAIEKGQAPLAVAQATREGI